MKRIVSHLNPRHLDDWLSIIVLRHLEKIEVVEYVKEVTTDMLDDVETYVVDIGGNYSPDKNNYDHHQDIYLPSSIMQILHKYNIPSSDSLYTIDMIDRFGINAVKNINTKTNQLRKIILAVDPKDLDSKDIEYIYRLFIDTKNNDYDTFIYLFVNKLLKLKQFQVARDNLNKIEQEKQDKLDRAKFIIDKIKIIYSTETLAPYHYDIFEETKADIIIERNSREPEKTGIIKNSKGDYYNSINIQDIPYEASFIHATGFMGVFNVDVEKIDLDKIIDVLKTNIK